MKTSDSKGGSLPRLDLNSPAMARKRRIRAFRGRLTGWLVSVGGLAVLATITLIFFYLAYIVLPIFKPASVDFNDPVYKDAQLGTQAPLLFWVEDQNKLAMRLRSDGVLHFVDLDSGKQTTQMSLLLPEGTQITAVGEGPLGTHQTVVGLSNGQALVFELSYQVSYPNGVRAVTPQLSYPFGDQPIDLDPEGRALQKIGMSARGTTNLLLVGAHDQSLSAVRISATQNLMTGEATTNSTRVELPVVDQPIKALLMDPRQIWLYLITGKSTAQVYDMRNSTLQGTYELLPKGGEVTAVKPLLGGISLLVGSSTG